MSTILTIYLDSTKKKPYYEQIYDYIKTEIKNGNLPYKTKLPSSRGLAKNLEVSRSTVDTAYAQLAAEGYIESSPKRGYFVAEIDELLNIVPVAYPPQKHLGKKEIPCRYDFSPVGADLLNFPNTYWRKLSKECINYESDRLFQSSEPMGDYGLRVAIRNYLRQNRGVNCSEENIIVGAGSQYLMMLLLRLLGKNSKIAMENPAYINSYETFRALEYSVLPISIDEHGLQVEELKKTDANICYVTPSHQYPSGVVMPVSRRTKLLNWANYEPNRYIIEDDYDSEFRYQGKPIPALQSMDKGKKVIYMGSFSKVISPAVRMSYMVLPDVLMNRYREIFAQFPSTVSRLDQAIMTRFIQEGYFERHLNRLRLRYKARHDAMILEFKKYKENVVLKGTNAGSHILLEWHGRMQEEELYESALKASIRVYPLKDYCIVPCFSMYPEFLFGFGRLSENEIQSAIGELMQIWE